MKIGMMWYDDDKKTTLDEKIAKVAAHYFHKYGVSATVCFVNPAMLDGKIETKSGGLMVKVSRTVQPNNFWLGVER